MKSISNFIIRTLFIQRIYIRKPRYVQSILAFRSNSMLSDVVSRGNIPVTASLVSNSDLSIGRSTFNIILLQMALSATDLGEYPYTSNAVSYDCTHRDHKCPGLVSKGCVLERKRLIYSIIVITVKAFARSVLQIHK
jgi:hypothetical protein